MTWFSRLRNWQTDEGNGIGIRADFHDSEDDNFASGINLALNVAGGNSPTANIPMGGFRFTGASDGVAATDFATLGQAQTAIASYAVDSVGTDSYAVTLTPTVTAYTAGLRVRFKAGASNTGTASLNVNGLGAKTIKRDKDVNLSSNNIISGQVVTVVYDGTNFQLQSPSYSSLTQNGSAIYDADTGAANAYVITLSPVPPAYVTGMIINFTATNANTGSSTINVNGLGAKTLKRDSGVNLARGDILASQALQAIYDGTNFQLTSPVGGIITQNGTAIFAADAGGTDAYAITLSPAPSAYVTGMMINFVANTTNTGTASLNVNGLGAKTIVKNFNTALADGDVLAGQINTVVYDGTNFQLPNATGTGSSSTSSSYVTMSSDGTLTAERVLTAGSGITITDGGANSTVTIAKSAGGVLQVVQTSKTDTFTTTNTSPTDITGMSVTITPASASNKVLILAYINFTASTSNAFVDLLRGASIITQGDAASSRTRSTTSVFTNVSTGIDCSTIAYLDSPATTSATTYKLQGWCSSGTFAFNRSVVDTDGAAQARCSSTIIAMEIKG